GASERLLRPDHPAAHRLARHARELALCLEAREAGLLLPPVLLGARRRAGYRLDLRLLRVLLQLDRRGLAGYHPGPKAHHRAVLRFLRGLRAALADPDHLLADRRGASIPGQAVPLPAARLAVARYGAAGNPGYEEPGNGSAD